MIARSLFAFALVVPFAAAQAANLVVVEARGIAMRVGTQVDSTKPLALKQGQHLTLITPAGATLKLDGPYDRAPDEAQGQGVALNAVMTALVTERQSRIGEVGTTRGKPLSVPPTPWVLDVTTTGTVCLQDGATAVLWRPMATADADLVVMPSDRSWKAEARWPAGMDQITITTAVPLHAGASYFVTVAGTQSSIAIAPVPASLDNDSVRAAWMIGKGCEAQARALLNLR